MSKEAEDLIIDIPNEEISVGFDPDGLPKTILVEKDNPSVAVTDEPAREVVDTAVTDAVEVMKRERDDARRESEARAREAAEASRAAQIERDRASRAEADLSGVRDQGMRDRWQLVNSELQQITNGIIIPIANQHFLAMGHPPRHHNGS